MAEAAVLETILRSMCERVRNDDALLAQASVLLDDPCASYAKERLAA